MMKTEIRNALECDIENIASLEKATFSLPQSKEGFFEMIRSDGKHLLVALCDGEFAGYIGAYTVLGESDIMTVAVSENYRKNGIGKMLVNALFDELCGKSEAVFLEVRASNSAAISLYTSLGFEKIGMRKNYYKLPTEDAILYKKEL